MTTYKVIDPTAYFVSATQVSFSPDGGITFIDGIGIDSQVIDLATGATYAINFLKEQAEEMNYNKPVIFVYEGWQKINLDEQTKFI